MILLSIQASDNQIISGIPEYVTVESSKPSIIFYTLDGSIPNSYSEIYVSKIYLSYTTPTATLKLKAVGVDDESDIVEMTWGTSIPDFGRTALTGKEGISVLPAGKEPVNSMAVGSNGSPEKSSVIKFSELDILTSTSDRIGQPIPEGSTVPFIKFPTVTRQTNATISSPSDLNFDPKAQMIIVDGYAGFDSQKVRIINRPMGTMRPTSKIFDEKVHYDNMVSGDFARYMYNPKTKKLVLYYRESLDGRWLVSIQKVEAATLRFEPTGNPFVFRWIEDRSQSRLY